MIYIKIVKVKIIASLLLHQQSTELGESPSESVTVKLRKEDKSDTWEHAVLLPEPEVCRI